MSFARDRLARASSRRPLAAVVDPLLARPLGRVTKCAYDAPSRPAATSLNTMWPPLGSAPLCADVMMFAIIELKNGMLTPAPSTAIVAPITAWGAVPPVLLSVGSGSSLSRGCWVLGVGCRTPAAAVSPASTAFSARATRWSVWPSSSAYAAMLWSFLSTRPRKMSRWRAKTTPVASATSSLSCSTDAVLPIEIGYVVWSSMRTLSEMGLGSASAGVATSAPISAGSDADEEGDAMGSVRASGRSREKGRRRRRQHAKCDSPVERDVLGLFCCRNMSPCIQS